VPHFFTRANIVFSEPIYVSSGLSYDETSLFIKNCELKLQQLQKTAERFVSE
jgi:hypothetical protein